MLISTKVLDRYNELSFSAQPAGWEAPLHLKKFRTILSHAAEDPSRICVPLLAYDRNNLGNYHQQWSTFYKEVSSSKWVDPIRAILLESVAKKLEFARAVQIGDSAYNKFQLKLHGLPSNELVELAWKILNADWGNVDLPVTDDSLEFQTMVTAEKVKDAMIAALKRYGLSHWQVDVVGDLAAGMSINGTLNRVRIDDNLQVTKAGLNRLLAHEIGGHILRWENSRQQKEPWVAVPLGTTTLTEEGFALWHEMQMKVLLRSQLRIYAARVVAVQLAQSHGILGVLHTLLPYLNKRDAISIAIRVKRGLLDPNKPGGQLKDWSYLGGLIAVTKAIEADPCMEKLLAVTKWPLECSEAMRELWKSGRIQEPLLIPQVNLLGIKHD